MADTDQWEPATTDSGAPEEPEVEAPRVTAHSTTPDRIVFTEEGNTDGWIATDLAVDCWR